MDFNRSYYNLMHNLKNTTDIRQFNKLKKKLARLIDREARNQVNSDPSEENRKKFYNWRHKNLRNIDLLKFNGLVSIAEDEDEEEEEVEEDEIMGAVEVEKNEEEREILSRELEMFDENLKELLKEEKLGENKEKYLNDIQDSLLFLATNKLKKYPSFYKEIMDWAKENDDKIKSKRGGRKRKTRKLQKKKKTIKKRKQGGKRKTKKN